MHKYAQMHVHTISLFLSYVCYSVGIPESDDFGNEWCGEFTVHDLYVMWLQMNVMWL